jgi:predicted alpha/beta-hydrolase family hydrolase
MTRQFGDAGGPPGKIASNLDALTYPVTSPGRPRRIRRSHVTSTVADTAQRGPVKVRQLLTLSDLAQIWLIRVSGADRNELHLRAPNRRSA